MNHVFDIEMFINLESLIRSSMILWYPFFLLCTLPIIGRGYVSFREGTSSSFIIGIENYLIDHLLKLSNLRCFRTADVAGSVAVPMFVVHNTYKNYQKLSVVSLSEV